MVSASAYAACMQARARPDRAVDAEVAGEAAQAGSARRRRRRRRAARPSSRRPRAPACSAAMARSVAKSENGAMCGALSSWTDVMPRAAAWPSATRAPAPGPPASTARASTVASGVVGVAGDQPLASPAVARGDAWVVVEQGRGDDGRVGVDPRHVGDPAADRAVELGRGERRAAPARSTRPSRRRTAPSTSGLRAANAASRSSASVTERGAGQVEGLQREAGRAPGARGRRRSRG